MLQMIKYVWFLFTTACINEELEEWIDHPIEFFVTRFFGTSVFLCMIIIFWGLVPLVCFPVLWILPDNDIALNSAINCLIEFGAIFAVVFSIGVFPAVILTVVWLISGSKRDTYKKLLKEEQCDKNLKNNNH